MKGPRSAAPASAPPLRRILRALRKVYGKPEPPEATDPFAQVLRENVAYLADDSRRDQAFALLRKKVGLDAKKILAAPRALLLEIGRFGILPEGSVGKLREIAETAISEFGGNLEPIRKLALADAKKALRKFPSIGEPAAEKILLFARIHPVFSLDSNVLRVLLRLGYGQEQKSYTASYRSAQQAVEPELSKGFDGRIEAYQLLRRHGQQICRRSHPLCETCPVRASCVYARSLASGDSLR